MFAFSCWKLRNIRINTILRRIQLCSTSPEDIADLASDQEYNKLAGRYMETPTHTCLIIQPYVKWGPNKLGISPEEQLIEAVALIRTLPNWRVKDTVKIPLDNLDRKALFKSGSMERIRSLVFEHSDVTAIFINSGTLSRIRVDILEQNLHRPVLDRYKIVMEILKVHAISKHSKLQVALAELYYIQRKSEQDLMFRTYNKEVLNLMFKTRENKLRKEIDDVRKQRELLRNRRLKMDLPVVAVVGYTNAGKTSIIKVLTGEDSLKPKDQLFATLDVTVHRGRLPSGLPVLYIDTVGFISDIPTNLIECFVATLEDALLADVILVVEDISCASYKYKKQHVLKTLKQLEQQTGSPCILNKMISVGNKCDLISGQLNNDEEDRIWVSASTGFGLDELSTTLEDLILKVTERKKLTIRVPNGGEEIRWLHHNCTVLDEIPDKDDLQFVYAKCVISQICLNKFKKQFIC